MAEPLVTLASAAPAVVVTLNRPERHNALVPELLEAFLAAISDPRCVQASAVIIAAQGRSFSTGGDLLGFWENRHAIANYSSRLVGLLNKAIMAIHTHPTPVACAVQGQVTGGSMGFLLAAQHVVMHRDATITPWYSVVNFSPDGGWMNVLPDVIGKENTHDWLENNRTNTAATCLELGLVHQVTDECVLDKTIASLQQLPNTCSAQWHPGLTITPEQLSTRLENERKAFIRQIQTPEAITGIARFLKKNPIEEPI